MPIQRTGDTQNSVVNFSSLDESLNLIWSITVDVVSASPVSRSFAGATSAFAALAIAETISSVDTRAPTVVQAAGLTFTDWFAGTLKDVAVAIFGIHHKTALVIGTWTVIIGLAALASRSAEHSRRYFRLLTAVIGLIGFLAYVTRPLANTMVGVIALALGLGVGSLLHRHLTSLSGSSPTEEGDTEMPGTALGSRRRFMVVAGASIVSAAGAMGATKVVRRNSIASEPQALQPLPAPTNGTTVDAATFDSIDGITPYITPNDNFYRIDTALVVPKVDTQQWSLTIDGLVDTPLSFTYEELIEQSTTVETVTIACVSNEIGGDLVGNAEWQGIPLSTILQQAGVNAGATQIFSHSVDGFTAGMPTEVALDGRTALIATAMNGSPLPTRHGFPARLIISGLYGYVSATKWLSRLELTTWEAADGYWIPRGWSKEAPIKVTSRIDVPQRKTISAGLTPIAGVALSPSVGIADVHVSVDDGPWQRAELADATNDNTWVQWSFKWEATTGDHTIRVRATDRNGVVQDETPRSVAPDGATGYHQRRLSVQ